MDNFDKIYCNLLHLLWTHPGGGPEQIQSEEGQLALVQSKAKQQICDLREQLAQRIDLETALKTKEEQIRGIYDVWAKESNKCLGVQHELARSRDDRVE